VIFNIAEDSLPAVRKKMQSETLRIDAYDRDLKKKLAQGHLMTIDNQIDPSTGTAKLKAVFDNKDSQLWPNQFVNSDLLLETRKNSIVVPTAAILRGPQGPFVYTVNPDKTVQDKAVTIALTQGDVTVVTDGVSPGDTVVTDGQDKLQRGSHIEPRGGPPSKNTTAPVTGAVERPAAGSGGSSAAESAGRRSHGTSAPGAGSNSAPGD
jgi:multidrug efflux system membrane fusion protein